MISTFIIRLHAHVCATISVAALLLAATAATASWRTVEESAFPEKAFAVSAWTPVETGSNFDWLNAIIGVGCESDGHQWVYIKVSDSVQDSVSNVAGQINWGNSASYTAPFKYYNKSRTLFLQAGVDDAILLLQGSSSVRIKLSWNDFRTTTFDFQLTDSRRAIDQALIRCRTSTAS